MSDMHRNVPYAAKTMQLRFSKTTLALFWLEALINELHARLALLGILLLALASATPILATVAIQAAENDSNVINSFVT